MVFQLSKDGCPFPITLMGTILHRTGNAIALEDLARLTWRALRMCGSEELAIAAIKTGELTISGAEWQITVGDPAHNPASTA